MKLVKSLLLGTAAGFAAVAGAQAADLPVKKAAPVEFVRVCSAYGAGFFYIPGTDTCLRVSGRARFEYNYSESLNRNGANGDVSGYRGLARFNLDARTQTAYGTLRAFVRIDAASRTGGQLTSGSQQRFGQAFPALGQDTFGRSQQNVFADKAFIQFAGFTAGKAASFFDFYAHDLEFIGNTSGSDVSSTNVFAYTATLGNGFSATISMEDPTFRRQPVFSNNGTSLAQTAFNAFTSSAALSPVVSTTDAFGNPTSVAFYDITQKNRMPDFVGALRYDAPWGSAQLSAAVHEINVGSATSFAGVNGGAAPANLALPRASNAYGWAVQGGVKINTPFIAPGDLLYLQGAYGQGAMSYTGFQIGVASETTSAGFFNGAQFPVFFNDAVLNPFTRKLELSETFTFSGAFLHYWTPEWRSAFFGSYGEVHYSKAARFGLGLVGFGVPGLVVAPGGNAGAAANAFNFSNQLRDAALIFAGASLIWSPVRDLDIGVEGAYQRQELLSGRTADGNRNIVTVNGVPQRTANKADNFLVRFRVQRDF